MHNPYSNENPTTLIIPNASHQVSQDLKPNQSVKCHIFQASKDLQNKLCKILRGFPYHYYCSTNFNFSTSIYVNLYPIEFHQWKNWGKTPYHLNVAMRTYINSYGTKCYPWKTYNELMTINKLHNVFQLVELEILKKLWIQSKFWPNFKLKSHKKLR